MSRTVAAQNQYPSYMFARDANENVVKRLVHDYGEEQQAIADGFVDSKSKLDQSSVQRAVVAATGVSQADVDAVIEKAVLLEERVEDLTKENESLKTQLAEAMQLLEDFNKDDSSTESGEKPKSKSKGKK